MLKIVALLLMIVALPGSAYADSVYPFDYLFFMLGLYLAVILSGVISLVQAFRNSRSAVLFAVPPILFSGYIVADWIIFGEKSFWRTDDDPILAFVLLFPLVLGILSILTRVLRRFMFRRKP